MIIGSEEKMLALLSLFDASIEEIERMEASLDVYDRKLSVSTSINGSELSDRIRAQQIKG